MSIDEILKKAKGVIITPDNGSWSYMTTIEQDKQALYKDMVELIGDEPQDKDGLMITGKDGEIEIISPSKVRNQLRQELRTKLKEYYGIEE